MKRLMTYKSAAIYALIISVFMHLLFVIMFFYGKDAMMHRGGGYRPEPTLNVEFMLYSTVANFLLAFLLYVVNFRFLNSEIKRGKVFYAAAATVVIALCFSYCSWLLSEALFEFQSYRPHLDKRRMMGMLSRDFSVACIIYFSAMIIYLSYKKQQMALEYEALKAENAQSRYEALKSQIDPHFLFNTLNTLNSMIKLDPDKAQEYIQQLCSVFRYTLQSKDVITLEEELAFTKDYCALMQVRYGENLNFDFRIDDKYRNWLVVPLSLQTLVENAVKHNVISGRQPLRVIVLSNDNDTITVLNQLNVKKETEAGEGIGLVNLAERYRLKWQREIDIRQNEYVFSVTLPLIEDRRK